jgi:outer membrane protease
MKRILALTLLTIALWTCSGAAQAAPPFQQRSGDTTFGIGLGSLNGNTLYHISVYDATGGVESELEFPLNTFLLNLEGGYVSKNEKGQDAFRIGLQWSMNIGSGSGKLKDSDWLTDSVDIIEVGSPHPGLDIYSESDITLRANIIDLRGSYNNWISDNLSIGPLGGFLYQNFQFDARNVHQTGYGPYAPGYTGSVSGLVLTYEVTYTIPYFGIHTEIPFSNKFQAMVDLGYSPWAAAEDKDDHVLRKKTSNAKTSGSAFLATITAQWDMEDNDFFLIRGQYLEIKTTGTQTQTYYDGSGDFFTGINDRIDSKQISASVLFSHRF